MTFMADNHGAPDLDLSTRGFPHPDADDPVLRRRDPLMGWVPDDDRGDPDRAGQGGLALPRPMAPWMLEELAARERREAA